VDVHMKNLRTKLQSVGQGDIIVTIRGIGYQIK
jgi:DNA-binding response OmpR family regulator